MSDSILPSILAATWTEGNPEDRAPVGNDDNVVLKQVDGDVTIAIIPDTYCPCPFSEYIGHSVVQPGTNYRGFSYEELLSYYSRKR